MEALQVNYDGFAAGVLGEYAGEAGVPDDLVGGVRSAAVHLLGKSFVHAVEQDEELTLGIVQVLGFHAVERTALVNRMDHGPGQREEGDPVALQRQLIVLPYGAAVGHLEPREQKLGLHLDDLVAAAVYDSEIKGGDSARRRKHGGPAGKEFPPGGPGGGERQTWPQSKHQRRLPRIAP